MRRSWLCSGPMLRVIAIILIMLSDARGAIVFEGPIFSETFHSNRFVRVYVPPSYSADKNSRYPVLYVHDGQNAFSSVGPHVAFGWGNWELDKTAERLAREGKMEEIIIVAVDCSAGRYREYRGPVPPQTNNVAYEKYRKFLVEELKTKIDREYRTLTNASNTGLVGSSMGGICSLAMAWEQPEVFGKVASLSGAYQVEKQYFTREVLGTYQGKRKAIKVYLDSGITDFSGGDDGAKETAAVAGELKRIGWKEGVDLVHFTEQPLTAEELKGFNLAEDKFAEAQRSQHNEFYWRRRAWRALTFLFPPPSQ